MLLAILAGIVSGVSNTGLLALINRALTANHQNRGTPYTLYFFVGLCALVPMARIVSEVLLTRIGQHAVLKLQTDISRQVLAVPQRELERIGAPRLLAVLTGDIPTIANVIASMPVLSINGAIILGCLIYLGLLSWQVLAALCALIAAGAGAYQLAIAGATRHFSRGQAARDRLYKHFRALLDGSKELKLNFERRREFAASLDATAGEQSAEVIAGQRTYTMASSWGQLLVFVVVGALLFGGLRPLAGPRSAELLTAYTLVLLYLMQPLQIVIRSLPGFTQAAVALRAVQAMGLDLALRASESHAAEPAPWSPWRRLELIGVTHAYHRDDDEREFELGPVDFVLEPGELVFVAGGNGSGKTTLAKLLVGLYVPAQGEMRCNGLPVTEANRESYRQLFAVVFSDFFLFDRLLGLRSISLDDRARDYLVSLRIADKVKVKSGKLSTTDLSQGQRKRLALLTAFLEDRPIYVFDEWAADQDPLFKDIFYLEILPQLRRRGKAVVAITHDDRYYQLADRLVKLESGQVTSDTRQAESRARLWHQPPVGAPQA